jgi:hypothetical protein
MSWSAAKEGAITGRPRCGMRFSKNRAPRYAVGSMRLGSRVRGSRGEGRAVADRLAYPHEPDSRR